jgi:hypothetical protein
MLFIETFLSSARACLLRYIHSSSIHFFIMLSWSIDRLNLFVSGIYLPVSIFSNEFFTNYRIPHTPFPLPLTVKNKSITSPGVPLKISQSLEWR